jgi:hypothetical protein
MSKGNSNRNIVYKCTRCGREVGRNNLVAKRAVFREMGVHGRTVKSTTTDWLCIIRQPHGGQSCRDQDTDWQAPKWINSPGLADTRKEDDATT